MEIKKETVDNDVSLGDMVFKAYKTDKNPYTSKQLSAFQLKMAVINGSQEAKQEVNRLVELYLSTENYERALPYCKIVHFNDKKGLENTLNLLLYQAVKNNNLKNVRFMINSGADVNRLPAVCASSTHNNENSKLNNEDSEQPDAPSRSIKNTLLHIACFKDNSEMAALLMLSGAAIFEKNIFNQTPRDVNPSCFNSAWLLVHGKTFDQKETSCEKLGISSTEHKELTTQAKKHFECNMSDSSDDLEPPPLMPTRTPENNPLHIACFKNDHEKAALLMISGAPLFDKNNFNQTPRDINPLCFDTAWLIMHDKMQGQEKAACEKLDISLHKYRKLTTQAEAHIKKHNLDIAEAEENTKNKILKTIQTKYFELLEKDKESSTFGLTIAKYPNHKTIKDVINHAFKNIDQFYSSTILLFRQENRSLRALKELNYITHDNKLSETAPQQFKKEFESRFLMIEDFVIVDNGCDVTLIPKMLQNARF